MLKLSLLTIFCAAISAQAGERLYASPHPVPAAQRGGFCHLAASHAHDYEPHVAGEYRTHDGQLVFIADPSQVPTYRGPLYRYDGPHPIPEDVSLASSRTPFTAQCSAQGLHQHAFEPPPSAPFAFRAGVFKYRGGAAADSATTARAEKKPARSEVSNARTEDSNVRTEKSDVRTAEQSVRIADSNARIAESGVRIVVAAPFFEESKPFIRTVKKHGKQHRKRHQDHDDEDEDDDDDDQRRKHDDDD